VRVRREEREEGDLTQHDDMASTSAKQPYKTVTWLKVNGFDSRMVKDIRF
jgi:hypothetical protein